MKAHSPKQRILIVDDDTLNVVGLKEVLQAMHEDEVDTAFSGQQSIDMASLALQKGHPYSLIFMDLQMHEVDGFMAARELSKLYFGRDKPQIVAVTGHVEPGFIQKAWEHDIDEFVAKPVKEDLLRKIIGENMASQAR